MKNEKISWLLMTVCLYRATQDQFFFMSNTWGNRILHWHSIGHGILMTKTLFIVIWGKQWKTAFYVNRLLMLTLSREEREKQIGEWLKTFTKTHSITIGSHPHKQHVVDRRQNCAYGAHYNSATFIVKFEERKINIYPFILDYDENEKISWNIWLNFPTDFDIFQSNMLGLGTYIFWHHASLNLNCNVLRKKKKKL